MSLAAKADAINDIMDTLATALDDYFDEVTAAALAAGTGKAYAVEICFGDAADGAAPASLAYNTKMRAHIPLKVAAGGQGNAVWKIRQPDLATILGGIPLTWKITNFVGDLTDA